MNRFAFTLGLALLASTPALAQNAAQDAEKLSDCITMKAGPEGDIPSSGPLREKFLKQMEGGVQACIGIIREPCQKAGADGNACVAREARGWLRALSDVKGEHLPEKNRKIWRAAVSRVESHAVALCEGAAALSAWGSEKVTKDGKYGMGILTTCAADAVAQQAIHMLTWVRGN